MSIKDKTQKGIMSFKKNMIQYCNEKGKITQNEIELAKRIGVTQRTIQNWKKEEEYQPCKVPLEGAINISLDMGVSLDYLCGFGDYKNINNKKIGLETGLSNDAINTLKKFRNDKSYNNALNSLLENPIVLQKFLSLVEVYHRNYNASMHLENGSFIPDNYSDGILIDTRSDCEENNVVLGEYDQSLCDGKGGYRVTAFPVNDIKNAYVISQLQNILQVVSDRMTDKENN